MTDVWMVATILAFFAAAALLVRGLGRVTADTAGDAEFDDDVETSDAAGSMLETERRS